MERRSPLSRRATMCVGSGRGLSKQSAARPDRAEKASPAHAPQVGSHGVDDRDVDSEARPWPRGKAPLFVVLLLHMHMGALTVAFSCDRQFLRNVHMPLSELVARPGRVSPALIRHLVGSTATGVADALTNTHGLCALECSCSSAQELRRRRRTASRCVDLIRQAPSLGSRRKRKRPDLRARAHTVRLTAEIQTRMLSRSRPPHTRVVRKPPVLRQEVSALDKS